MLIARLLGLQHTDEVRVGLTFPPPALRQASFTYQINLNVRQFVIFDRDYGLTAQMDIHVFDTGSTVHFASPFGSTAPAVRFCTSSDAPSTDFPGVAA
ncbi:hypothetical protein [Streptomyces sp. HC307]|uniref:hypothetical protein n=1 Tax=Streptomyces flavusporus TaxID=3385496 RepID=UPI003916D203